MTIKARRAWALLRLLGATRLRGALLAAALAATFLTVLTSLPAQADPAPTPAPAAAGTPAVSAQPPATGAPAPSPGQQALLQQVLQEQAETLTPDQQQAQLAARADKLRALLPAQGGVLSVFNVTDASGIPIEAYTARSDTGGITDWDLGIYNLLTELAFMMTKWAVAFACWAIAWALSFGLAKILLTPVAAVAQSLHTRVIVEMGLPSLALSVCALVCVARILFGDRARGWGDAALSLLLAALTTTLLASPPTLLMDSNHGAIAAARGLALEVADAILQSAPAAPGAPTAADPAGQVSAAALARPITDALTTALIVQPSELLRYGQVFSGDCAASYSTTLISQLAYDQAMSEQMAKLKKATDGIANSIPLVGGALSTGNDALLGAASQWAADHFGTPPSAQFEARCVHGDAASQKKASLDKVAGALFLLIAALIITALIAALTWSFLVAQVRIGWDAIRGEAALVAGTVPGAGRGWLWDWCASVLRSLAQMLTSVIVLAVVIVVVQALLTPTQDDWGHELTLRFLAIDIVAIATFHQRRRLAERSRQISHAWRTKMNAGRIGGTHGSIFTPPAPTARTGRPVAQSAARAVVRTAMAGVTLASGNPIGALGYALPSSIGAVALASRLATGSRTRRAPIPAARPAGRPLPPQPIPAETTAQPGPAPQPSTEPATVPTPAVPATQPATPATTPTPATAPEPEAAPEPVSATTPEPAPSPTPRQSTGMALDWTQFATATGRSQTPDPTPPATTAAPAPASESSSGQDMSERVAQLWARWAEVTHEAKQALKADPAPGPARTPAARTRTAAAAQSPRPDRPAQPAASAQQQRLRRRLDRAGRRTPPGGRR